MIRIVALAVLLLATRAACADDALHVAQSRAAQVVTGARVAGILCPGIQPDEDGIRALMEHAQITDQDIMRPDRFGLEDEAMALSFKQSLVRDPEFCAKVVHYIGEGGMGLVRHHR